MTRAASDAVMVNEGFIIIGGSLLILFLFGIRVNWVDFVRDMSVSRSRVGIFSVAMVRIWGG
jgi:hypothetical protein